MLCFTLFSKTNIFESNYVMFIAGKVDKKQLMLMEEFKVADQYRPIQMDSDQHRPVPMDSGAVTAIWKASGG